MSIENHPNFHAVKFVTDVVSTLYELYDNPPKAQQALQDSYHLCLRGKANSKNVPDVCLRITGFLYAGKQRPTRKDIVEFVSQIENLVDGAVGELQ